MLFNRVNGKCQLALFLTKHRKKWSVIMFKVIFMSCLFCMSLVVGCAANSPKHFDKKLARLDRKGIVLATITSDNRLDKTDKLLPGAFVIRKNGGNEKEYVLYASNHFRVCPKDKESCLIVLEVNKGNHFISSIRGAVLGDFFLPVFEGLVQRNFQANINEIIYIGNIHMILRKKASDSEVSAGDALVPGRIIDQMAIAGTTIDIEINDEYERDMNEFEKTFPNLKGHTVIKRILPSQPISHVD